MARYAEVMLAAGSLAYLVVLPADFARMKKAPESSQTRIVFCSIRPDSCPSAIAWQMDRPDDQVPSLQAVSGDNVAIGEIAHALMRKWDS